MPDFELIYGSSPKLKRGGLSPEKKLDDEDLEQEE